jgi:hypothetical protein
MHEGRVATHFAVLIVKSRGKSVRNIQSAEVKGALRCESKSPLESIIRKIQKIVSGARHELRAKSLYL